MVIKANGIAITIGLKSSLSNFSFVMRFKMLRAIFDF